MTQIITRFSEISTRYKVAFVDLWGCVHNGLKPFPPAVKALSAYRKAGGVVVLVTNSPRTRHAVEKQLAKIGVSNDAWDTIATSGDSTRVALFLQNSGNRVFVIGEVQDKSFFAPMEIIDAPPPTLEHKDIEATQSIICLDMADDYTDPEDARPLLEKALKRGLTLFCANPDVCVDKGTKRVWCAGAIAQLYTKMGGQSLYFGKPHPPIYELAWRRLEALNIKARARAGDIIAIGDGIATDVMGAANAGIDCLFVSGGLHAKQTGTLASGAPTLNPTPTPPLLQAFLAETNQSPKWTIGKLC